MTSSKSHPAWLKEGSTVRVEFGGQKEIRGVFCDATVIRFEPDHGVVHVAIGETDNSKLLRVNGIQTAVRKGRVHPTEDDTNSNQWFRSPRLGGLTSMSPISNLSFTFNLSPKSPSIRSFRSRFGFASSPGYSSGGMNSGDSDTERSASESEFSLMSWNSVGSSIYNMGSSLTQFSRRIFGVGNTSDDVARLDRLVGSSASSLRSSNEPSLAETTSPISPPRRRVPRPKADFSALRFELPKIHEHSIETGEDDSTPAMSLNSFSGFKSPTPEDLISFNVSPVDYAAAFSSLHKSNMFGYAVGESVQVLVRNGWFDGKIVDVNEGGNYRVRLDDDPPGFASNLFENRERNFWASHVRRF